ncbi:MAG TPA: L-lactate permease [Rhizomicrobium sp.]|jgi:lactate permease
MLGWAQNYDPFNNPAISALVAAIPIVLLLAIIATNKMSAHLASLIAIVVAIIVAVFGFHMPAELAAKTTALGVVSGFFPIGWIILNVIFLYRLTVDKGMFAIFQHSMGSVTADRRLQLLLIAFCFGAFFEGAAGFGTPVAVTAAMLMGLGFSPLAAAGLSLIADTATVAFGALGTPIQALSASTGMDPFVLGQIIGRQSSVFALIVPFWLIWAFVGWKKMWEVWPAILVAALGFAIPQFIISNYINPWIVDIVAGGCAMAVLVLFLRVWQPKEIWTSTKLWGKNDPSADSMKPSEPLAKLPTNREIFAAWVPWIILCVVLGLWATDLWKGFVNPLFSPTYHVPGMDKLIHRMPPIVAKPTDEAAVFSFTFLSYSGTGILLSAILAGLFMGYSPAGLVKQYFRTMYVVRYSLITISAMLALGTLTRYSGVDGTLGLAFARTGFFYPFFGTALGWLGVAATGSDTAANVLFGGLQKITAQQLGINPVLMAAANSTGGVMGKMVDTQSIVVAATATGWYGHEGSILRFVFWHSIALVSLVGILVMLQAYVWPFTLTVPVLP